MKVLRIVAAVLLALPLVVFGGLYFTPWLPTMPDDGTAGHALLLSMREGGLMSAIAASHVLIGLGLLVPRTRFLSALLQLPMSIGILCFHLTMQPAGAAFAGVLLLLNLGAMAEPDRLRALVAVPESQAAAAHD